MLKLNLEEKGILRDLKIAIATNGNNGMDDTVSNVFGETRTFTIANIGKGKIKDTTVLKNSLASYGISAGLIVIQTLVDKGVDILLTGYVGPKALMALENTGIKIYESININDTVRDAVIKFKQGAYKEKALSLQDTSCRPGMRRDQSCGGGRGMGRGRRQGGAFR